MRHLASFCTGLPTPVNLLCGLALLTASACSDVPSDAQCEKFLDHVIALEVNAGTASAEEKPLHIQRLKEAKQKEFLEQCATKIKASHIECALKATRIEEIEKCEK